MDLVKQVCTLEQAKKLKTLGIEQNLAGFFYSKIISSSQTIMYFDTQDGNPSSRFHTIETWNDEGFYIKAYTVAELGVMLPPHSEYKEGLDKRPFIEYYPHTHKEEWKAYNPFSKSGSEKIVFDSNTESEARAAMLLWLLENNHTTPEEVNTRLNNQ